MRAKIFADYILHKVKEMLRQIYIITNWLLFLSGIFFATLNYFNKKSGLLYARTKDHL